MNTFGNIFRLTTFGESHGAAIGGVIDGMPAGVAIDVEAVQQQLSRRRPGQSALVTSRNEPDEVEFLSGIFEGVTTGTPIGFIIRNQNQHSSDYEAMRHVFRPNHADFTYQEKYGVRDHRGGGRSSARETAARVVAGALAAQALGKLGVKIVAYTSRIGRFAVTKNYTRLNLANVDSNPVRCPDGTKAAKMIGLLNDVRAAGNTVGGVVSCVISGVPAGVGEPVAGKLHAQLAAAMMSINAAKGFEYGLGFRAAECLGTDVIDNFNVDSHGRVRTASNYSGGIQGGISNGEDIYFNVAFKPVATLLQDVDTIDDNGNPAVLHAKGRHDPCVVPRAVPIVEAMAAITLLDAVLANRSARL